MIILKTFLLFVASDVTYLILCFMLLLFHGSLRLTSLGGFLTADLIGKIDALLRKAVRWGHSCELKCLSDLLHECRRDTIQLYASQWTLYSAVTTPH